MIAYVCIQSWEDVVGECTDYINNKSDEMSHHHPLIKEIAKLCWSLDRIAYTKDSPEHQQAWYDLKAPDWVLETLELMNKLILDFCPVWLWESIVISEAIEGVHEREDEIRQDTNYDHHGWPSFERFRSLLILQLPGHYERNRPVAEGKEPYGLIDAPISHDYKAYGNIYILLE